MTKWTRLQDKIASSRLLFAVLLIMFSCTFFLFFVRAETNFIMYFKYIFQGMITDFESIQQDGIANHHLQYVDLNGLVRYDLPLDIMNENHHVILRSIIIEDEKTLYAVLINNNHMYAAHEAEVKNISGIIRKMDNEMYDFYMESFHPFFDEMQTEGWTIEPRYYINELESFPKRDARRIFTFGIVNVLLIMITLGLALVPHPRTIKDMSKYERKLHTS